MSSSLLFLIGDFPSRSILFFNEFSSTPGCNSTTSPNVITHLSGFVTLCKAFLGIPSDWAPFKHYFYAKPQTAMKDVYQTCGTLGIQTKWRSSYFEMKWPDSLKGWTAMWFYCV